MRPADLDYTLPRSRIAQRPAVRRGDAQLLVVGDDGARQHASVRRLRECLPSGALLVVNDSRVVPARIDAQRDDARVFELLMCAPAASQTAGVGVSAWVRGAKKLRDGDVLRAGELALRVEGIDPVDARARRFTVVEGDVLRAIEDRGQVPLPPYIVRPQGPDDADAARYQTVFARVEGSVAAPTAGLHLDETLLAAVDVVSITLHVGPGTFLPMEVEDVRDHRVLPERVEVGAEAAARIEAARGEGRPVVAVGTTVTRALEAAARGGAVEPFAGTTDLVITPEHRFVAVDWLLTNFHLPRSSLLMLVCSFAGTDRVLRAYDEAIAKGYRFYSYGDCMLISRST